MTRSAAVARAASSFHFPAVPGVQQVVQHSPAAVGGGDVDRLDERPHGGPFGVGQPPRPRGRDVLRIDDARGEPFVEMVRVVADQAHAASPYRAGSGRVRVEQHVTRPLPTGTPGG